MSISPGSDLTLLLLAGFRSLADAAQTELAIRGYQDVRPANAFAIRAIASGADTAAELARTLTVSKQAAAQTITVLQERGYVTRAVDPNDARRRRLQVTDHGLDMLHESEVIFDELRAQWSKQIGAGELKEMETHLAQLTGPAPLRFDTPGWSSRDLGGTA
jgi:DNA-binding MarR family transcriptional regulator